MVLVLAFSALPFASATPSPVDEGRLAAMASIPSVKSAKPNSDAQAADPATFDETYEAHFDFVWRHVRRSLGAADIDDAVQDVFLVVHRKLRDFDGRVSIRAWLYGITQNVLRDHRRTARRKQAPLVPYAPDGDSSRDLHKAAKGSNVEARDALRHALALMDELDEDKREALWLSLAEGMSAPEIAECTQTNLNTVYARIRAGKTEFEAAYARMAAREQREQREQRGRHG